MGGTCIGERDWYDAANSAGYFWANPSYKELYKHHRPRAAYRVAGLLRGSKTILTRSEYFAALKIVVRIRAYLRKQKRKKEYRIRVKRMLLFWKWKKLIKGNK